MSAADKIHQGLDIAKAAVTGIQALDDVLAKDGHVHTHLATANNVLSKIRNVLDIIMSAFDGSVPADNVNDEIKKLHDELASNDAATDKQVDARFPKG